MTIIGTDLDRRCTSCGFDPIAQGHLSVLRDGTVTGCQDSGDIGRLLGARYRDQGMARTVQAHPDDAARVDAVLAKFIASRRPFSANDTRPLLAGVKGSVVGARFRTASTQGRIKRTGRRFPSTDPGTHSHHIDEWVGTAA